VSLFRGVTVGTTLTLDKGRWSKELRESKAELKAWSASAEKASTRMGSGWTKASKAFGHAVKYGFVAGGAAAAIGIGYAVKASMDFDQSMSKVKALTGATGKSFDGLRQQAILLGAKTTFSAGQAAQAMSELGAAGFSTTQIMTAMPGVLNAAAASGEDMASVASIMTATMNGFGLSAKNTAHIADVLAAAANDSSVSVADIGMSFKYVAPIAKVAHQSLENVAAVLAVLGNNGIKADTAGTSLRQGLLRVGTTGRDAYEALGISAFDAQGKMKALPTMVGDLHKALAGMSDQKRIAAIKAIFGVNASPAWALMIDKGPAQMEKLGQKYLKVDGAAKKMGLTMRDNVAGAWENFKGSLETVAISLDDLFKSKLKGGLQAAAAGFNQVTMALKGQGPHAKLVKQLITGIASGASVLKTILLQTGRAFVSSFRAASGGASGAAASFGGFAATVGQFAGTVLPAFASILGTTTGLLLSHKSAVLAAVGGYVAFKVASEVGTMLQGLNASLNIAGAAYGKLSAQQAIASLTAKGVAVSEAAVTVEIEAMTVAQKAATWAQLGFNKAITENPIGLVATGVALAAGAFLAWKSNSHDAESASDKATAANKRLLASMNAIRDANLASRSASFGYIDAVKHEKDATLAATAAGMKYGTHSKQYAAAQYEAARATAQREDAEARLGDAMKDRKTKSDNALKALRDDQQVMKDSGKNIDALRAAIGKMP
jgi:TP901 family phage tail tape measure protein